MHPRRILRPRALAVAVSTAWAAYAASALFAALPAAAQGTPTTGVQAATRHYHLPAGPLGATLMQIAQQSGQAIAVDPELVRARQAPAIEGDFTAAEAVQRAIGNSDLQLQRTDNGTLTLKRAADAAAGNQERLPDITVAGELERQGPTQGSDTYTVRQSSAATRLALSPRETPQSVSVVTRARMDDFGLNTINDVMANTAGVTVEKVETERTYFTSRGFDITNFQYDGVGIPLTYGNQSGDIDTFMYDRIEVVRGANGLSSSTGNPSATVNFVRKRPSYDFQASAGLTLSSWNTRRLDADISSALNEAGTVAARLVAAHQEGDSYLDRYKPTKDLFYGVVEANLSESTLATIGFSYQKVHGQGAMWGALPLAYADGSPARYGVGTSSSADWSFYDSTEQRTFAELNHKLANGWQWKSTVNYNEIKSNSALNYLDGNLDTSTGTGLVVYPSLFNGTNKQLFGDSNISGKYSLGGREHDLSVGVSWSRSRLDNISTDTSTGYFDVDAATAFNGSFPYPVFDSAPTINAYTDRRKTVYAATRLNLHERVKLLLGANYTRADSTGFADGADHVLHQAATSPYAGLVVDLNDNISAYGSYTKIFNPQTNIDVNHDTLAAATGKSYELGLKGEFFEKRLNASAAVFRSEQNNIAEAVDTFADGETYYKGIKARSEGVELELSGELAHNWQASAGATVLRIVGDDGASVRGYVPRKTLRLSTTYRLPMLQQLKVGASLNTQSKTSYNNSSSAYQGGYSVLNLMAHYDIDRHLSLSLNLNNVLNKQYLTSVYWNQSYYAAPINGSVALNWKY